MRRKAALLSAFFIATTIALANLTNFHIDYWAWCSTVLPGLISSVLLAFYAEKLGFRRLNSAAEILALHLLLIFPVSMSAYLAMHLNFPMADDQLHTMDAAVGFDWVTFIRFIDAHPWLAVVLGFAYQAFIPLLTISPLWIAFGGNQSRAVRALAAYSLIVVVASLVAIPFPAVGAYASSQLENIKHINFQFAFDFVEPLKAVRQDPTYVFRPESLAGIISFPSVHAAVAILCSWMWWTNKWMRYPMLAISTLMAISAIPFGGHYFVDVLAGIVIAFACIYVVQRIAWPSVNLRAPVFQPARVDG